MVRGSFPAAGEYPPGLGERPAGLITAADPHLPQLRVDHAEGVKQTDSPVGVFGFARHKGQHDAAQLLRRDARAVVPDGDAHAGPAGVHGNGQNLVVTVRQLKGFRRVVKQVFERASRMVFIHQAAGKETAVVLFTADIVRDSRVRQCLVDQGTHVRRLHTKMKLADPVEGSGDGIHPCLRDSVNALQPIQSFLGAVGLSGLIGQDRNAEHQILSSLQHYYA